MNTINKQIFLTLLLLFSLASVNAQFYNIEGTWKSNSGNTFYVKYSTNYAGQYTGLYIKNLRDGHVSMPGIVNSKLYLEKEFRSGTDYFKGPYSYYNEYYYIIINCFEIKVETYTNDKLNTVNYWTKLY
jgi:hypothetical protein